MKNKRGFIEPLGATCLLDESFARTKSKSDYVNFSNVLLTFTDPSSPPEGRQDDKRPYGKNIYPCHPRLRNVTRRMANSNFKVQGSN